MSIMTGILRNCIKLPMAYLQMVLIVSGNLSFLNWLTILPAIFCFDDLFLQWLFSSSTVTKVKDLQNRSRSGEKFSTGKLSQKL